MLAQVKTLANPTHNKYGTNNHAAFLSNFQDNPIAQIIVINNKRISMNADAGLWNPKNNKLHNALNNKLAPKTTITAFLCFNVAALFHAKYKENAIIIYKRVQTGANNHAGGINAGLTEINQSLLTPEVVNILPKAQTNTTKAKQTARTL